MQISVVMPVYNALSYIKKSLQPLLAMQQRGEIDEIIIVDDHSSDGSADYAAQVGITVIHSEQRQGPAAARNIGVKQATGDIVWFVDSDVVVHDNAARLIHKTLADSSIDAVFGAYDDQPPAPNFLSIYKNLVHHYYHSNAKQEALTFWAGCGAMRKAMFIAAGGFDGKRYPYPSVEDIELGYRISAAGGRIRLLPELNGTHLKVWRLGNLLHTEIFRRALPWSRLLLSRSDLADDLNISNAERLRAGLAGLWVLSIIATLSGLVVWWLPILLLVFLMLLNWRLAKLFFRRGGVYIAIAGLLFHQLYYLYSSAVFVYCWLENKLT